MDIHDRALTKYLALKKAELGRVPIFKEISEETGLNVTRVWRLFNSSPRLRMKGLGGRVTGGWTMNVVELGIFIRLINKMEAESLKARIGQISVSEWKNRA